MCSKVGRERGEEEKGEWQGLYMGVVFSPGDNYIDEMISPITTRVCNCNHIFTYYCGLHRPSASNLARLQFLGRGIFIN